MQHLNPEDLARLVDEDADAAEELHLQICGDCRAELEGLREQSRALGSLPTLAAPDTAWPELERRLLDEGLIAAPLRARWIRRLSLLRIAAGLALFLGGGVAGAALRAVRGGDGGTAPAIAAVQPATAEAAAVAVRTAEDEYRAALARYAELTGAAEAVDPVNRLAALEGIVLTARAALREAPADPVINGYLLTALGQRDAMLRSISRDVDDTWF